MRVVPPRPRNSPRYARYRRIEPRTTDRFLSGQHILLIRYLVVEVLDRLDAFCRFRFHRCRLRVAAADYR